MAKGTTTVGFEEKLWLAADKLRSNMDAAEYKHVVLGLIFLKYVSDSFEEKYNKLLEEGYGDEEDRDEYLADNIFYVPKEARWSEIQKHATSTDIGSVIDKAMDAIEKENGSLKGVLTKNYSRQELDKTRLGELVTLVDYIGMAAELKNALSQYTKRDQDKIPDLGQAYSVAVAKLEIMRDFFYGFDYTDFFGTDNSRRLQVIADGVDFALRFDEEEKKAFIKEATALSQAETLCRSLLDEKLKQEIAFFKSMKAGICKCGGNAGITSNEINARIMTMLEQAIEQDGVYNIFAKAGQKNPEISILSDEYMDQIRRMKHKNIAAEMLRKLLEDNIRVFARTGVVKAKLFSEKMQQLLKAYNNRLVTSAEVIEELLKLSQEMTAAYKAGDEKGLSTEELAFYDALVADPNVLLKMKDDVLVQMAHELTDLIRKNRTVDWDKKESARAYMRTQVKHLLRKYHYPPEKAKGAIDVVIKQAELMSSNIVL